ncbi:MAG TPA: DUF3263 domain-containing protein [Micromonospora sp.]|nr:DUF3263 domain-containing protein [Micromonospora sp.]
MARPTADISEGGEAAEPDVGNYLDADPDVADVAAEGTYPLSDAEAETAVTHESPRVPMQARPAESELTERERQVLAFERRWWRHAGAKEQAIRDTFGLSTTRYYQILNGLLDNPAALAAEPVLVGRLRRLRASRTRARRR